MGRFPPRPPMPNSSQSFRIHFLESGAGAAGTRAESQPFGSGDRGEKSPTSNPTGLPKETSHRQEVARVGGHLPVVDTVVEAQLAETGLYLIACSSDRQTEAGVIARIPMRAPECPFCLLLPSLLVSLRGKSLLGRAGWSMREAVGRGPHMPPARSQSAVESPVPPALTR